MKYKLFILSVFIGLFLLISGCDSPTESVSISITRPSLTEPADNATDVSLTPTFKWTGEADKLMISVNSSYSNPIEVNVSGNEHTLAAGILSPGTIYFWKAGKTSDGTVYWSVNNFRFTTAN
jgi:hypothetical protein